MRPSRRVAIVVLVAALAAVAARIAAPTGARITHPSGAPFGALTCGIERRSVKTLQDRPRLLRARPTTIAHLGSIKPPRSIPFFSRLPLEHRIFSVVAPVVLVRQESDQEFHAVLKSGKNQMITEAPSPACTQHATALRRRQMARARQAVRVCSRARVVGVAFFDHYHSQTGVALNAIELHPILGFACLASS